MQLIVRWWWAILATVLGVGLLVAVVCCCNREAPASATVSGNAKQDSARLLVITVPGHLWQRRILAKCPCGQSHLCIGATVRVGAWERGLSVSLGVVGLSRKTR